MKQKIIIYGTDIISDAFYEKICEKYEPVCFVSHRDSPGRDELYGLPVLLLENAVAAYPDSQILVVTSSYLKHEAIDWMLRNNIPTEKIMKVQSKVEERWGCPYTGGFSLFWNGKMHHCCSLATTYHLPIWTAYCQTGAETYQAFAANTRKLIESLQDNSFREKYCGTCPLLR